MFLTPRGSSYPIERVTCGSSVLTTENSSKYLGLEIDDDLSWSSRIAALESKISNLAGALWINGKSLTLLARRAWFISLVNSHLLYASNAFFTSLTSQLLE